MKKSLIIMCIFLLSANLLFAGGQKEGSVEEPSAKMSVMLYSSMQDAQLSVIKEGFIKKYPNISMDYYQAGTGKVLTKLAAEEQAGSIMADMFWIADPSRYLAFKEKDLLLPYVSPEAKTIPDALKDKDNCFTAARAIIFAIIWNKDAVKGDDIPKDWEDLLNPRFKGYAAMPDPTFSGSTLFTVAAFAQNPEYGWDFFKELKANGMRVEKGSSAPINKTGAGEYDVCIGCDYIARDKANRGANIAYVYPPKVPFIGSPIAIFKPSKNVEAAKKLYDYILSLEGQQVLIDAHVVPARPELSLEGALNIKDAVARAIPIDIERLKNEREDLIAKYNDIMKKE